MSKNNIGFAFLCMLVACGGSGGSGGVDPGKQQESVDIADSILGEWHVCSNYESIDTSILIHLTFTTETWQQVVHSYSGYDCDPSRLNESAAYSDIGAYEIGGLVKTDSGLDAYELNQMGIGEDSRKVCFTIVSVQGDLLFVGQDSGSVNCETEALRHNALDLATAASRINPSYVDVGPEDLDGKWQVCRNHITSFAKVTIHYDAGVFTATEKLYSDDECAQPLDEPAEVQRGTYSVGSAIQLSTGEWVLPIDYYPEDDASCYQIVSLQGDVLLIGENSDELDCHIVEERAVTLDYDEFFLRQK